MKSTKLHNYGKIMNKQSHNLISFDLMPNPFYHFMSISNACFLSTTEVFILDKQNVADDYTITEQRIQITNACFRLTRCFLLSQRTLH